MTEKEIIQIENEVFTQVVMEELRKQKAAGTAISDYVLDKYELSRLTAERLKKILAEQR